MIALKDYINENLFTHDVNKLITKLCKEFDLNKNQFDCSDKITNKNNESIALFNIECVDIKQLNKLKNDKKFKDIIDKFGYLINPKITNNLLNIVPKLTFEANELLKASNNICFRIINKKYIDYKQLKSGNVIKREIDTHDVLVHKGVVPKGINDVYEEGRIYLIAYDYDLTNEKVLSDLYDFAQSELNKSQKLDEILIVKIDLSKIKGTKITVYKDISSLNKYSIYTTQPIPKECIVEIYDVV